MTSQPRQLTLTTDRWRIATVDELNAPGWPFYNYWVMRQGIVVMADGNCDWASGPGYRGIAWLLQGLSRTSDTTYQPRDDVVILHDHGMCHLIVHRGMAGPRPNISPARRAEASLNDLSKKEIRSGAIHSNAIGTIDQLTAETPGSKQSRLTASSTTSLRRPATVSAARISMRSEFATSTL